MLSEKKMPGVTDLKALGRSQYKRSSAVPQTVLQLGLSVVDAVCVFPSLFLSQ